MLQRARRRIGAAGCLSCAVILTVYSLGCGAAPKGEDLSGHALSQQLKSIPLHATVEEIEKKLGSPSSRSDNSEESVLHYGLWRLMFLDGVLQERSREVWIGENANGSADLDQSVLDLRRGMSRRQVEVRLGRPTNLELVFINHLDRPDRVVLHYANWQLVFINGRLDVRTSF